MRTIQLLGQHHTSDEREDGRQPIKHQQHDRQRDALDENGCQPEEPHDPAEGCYVHAVVDRAVGLVLAGEDIADQGCDEQDPDELDPAGDGLEDVHCEGCEGCKGRLS